jgi:hypothetical protein
MLRLLWLAELVIPLNALRVEVSNWALPRNGRIAILLRGQAFRHWDGAAGGHPPAGCDVGNPDVVAAQLHCTDSLLKNIVAPLEQNHNSVEFFILNGNSKENCHSFDQLLMPKFGHRVVSVREYDSPDQAHNMKAVLNEFERSVGGHDIITKRYDLIIIARHDENWLTSISQWPTAEFGKLNLFSKCEIGFREKKPHPRHCDKRLKKTCVNDNFHMMPGSLWEGFRDAVGTAYCFHPDLEPFPHGHCCYPDFVERVGQDNITFITDWRPNEEETVRGPNDIAELT